MRAFVVLAALAACLVIPTAASAAPPPIRHVFVIVLENKNFDESFGPGSKSPYLARTVRGQGQLLTNYHGTGHFSLGNYLTLISGQSENADTQGDCQFFTPMAPGLIGADGQALGQGCLYPGPVRTIADQLEGRGLSWRSYNEDMGADRSRENATCAHPAVGTRDPTQSATARDQYATRHNPFVYFRSIIDDRAGCDRNVVNLSRLPGDLASAGRTPNYVFITPDLCSDGHDEDCVNPRQKGGQEGIDQFLETWVPRIVGSEAFNRDGLLLVTFDESESGAEACCFVPRGPNTVLQGIEGPGGGRTGMVAVSPFISPGSTNSTPYNHYSLLRSTEDLYGLGHLGYAARSEVRPFGSDVFNRKAGDPCLFALGRVGSRSVDGVVLGGRRQANRAALGRHPRLRRLFDSACLVGGGSMRVGYPSRRLRRAERRRAHGRALLVLSSGRRVRVRRVGPGDSLSRLRSRLHGERRIRVGRNVWYLARGRRARLVFKVRGRRVIEAGLASRRLTASRRGAARFLRSFR